MSTRRFPDTAARREFHERRLARMRRRADEAAPMPRLADRLRLGLVHYSIVAADHTDRAVDGHPFLHPFATDEGV